MPPLPLGLFSQDERGRLLAAALEVTTARGYLDSAAEDIAREAGVAPEAFGEHFSDQAECVLAAYDLITGRLGQRIVEALDGIEDWREAVRTAVETTLSIFSPDPRLARFCTIEIPLVGPAGVELYETTIEQLAVPLRAARDHCPWGATLPALVERTTIGGVIWMVAYRVRLDPDSELLDLVPDLTYFLLAPYLDPAEAKQYLTSVPPPRGSRVTQASSPVG